MDNLRRSSVPSDYDPMYSNLTSDSRAERAFGFAPSAFPSMDPSINLGKEGVDMDEMPVQELPVPFCRAGAYSVGVGYVAPGMQTAPPTQQLKEMDSYGVPVRVSRDGRVNLRGRASSNSSAKNHAEHACLMIAHSPELGVDGEELQGGGTHNAVYLSLSRYSGEYKCMDRNQAGWNITAFNRPHQSDRYSRSSAGEIRSYDELSEGRRGPKLKWGSYRWGEYGQWVISIDKFNQVAVTYYEEQPVPHWEVRKGVSQKSNRRQAGQLYLVAHGGFRIVGRPDKTAVGIMAHGQIYLGLDEAKQKGTNRKLVRTQKDLSQQEEPPWERINGAKPLGDVKPAETAPPKLIYCHGKSAALTLDSTMARVKTLAKKGGSRVQAVTAPWHGGAWGEDTAMPQEYGDQQLTDAWNLAGNQY